MQMAGTYTGAVSGVMDRSTHQKLTSTQKIENGIAWACFNKSPFLKLIGVEAFGVDAVKDVAKFNVRKTSGRIIRYDSGFHSMAGQVFATAGTTTHVDRLGSFTPQLVEGGGEWVYAWHRLIATRYIPDVDVQDNGNGHIDIKAHKMQEMKQSYVRDINYCILGHSSAPNYGTMGPSAVYNDLPNLISVDQTRTVGGRAKTNSDWQNGYKAITTIGGGGEMDRPLVLRRSLLDQHNDQMVYAEATDDYIYLETQGAFQYYDRLMYADSIQGGNGAVLGRFEKYDAAGIQYHAFAGGPMVWDPAVQVPYSGSSVTAGTEAIYGIHVPSFFFGLRSEESFKLSDWEPPRAHDQYKMFVAELKTRYTPGVTAMRPHWVAYNIPDCPD